MNIREAAVAGRFYENDPEILKSSIAKFFAESPVPEQDPESSNAQWSEQKPLLTMLPHAGHVYCGPVIAATLRDTVLPERLIILAPNHTGQGEDMGYWPSGFWRTPLGDLPVDEELGKELAELDPGFRPDIRPHLGEHDIEVLLPFIQTVSPHSHILPIVLRQVPDMERSATALASILRKYGPEVGIIVSSDMNHFANDYQTRKLDALAIDAILNIDAETLDKVVKRNQISMCGIWPALLGLQTCKKLDAAHSKLLAYDTSATASNDASRVVGYAGIKIW